MVLSINATRVYVFPSVFSICLPCDCSLKKPSMLMSSLWEWRGGSIGRLGANALECDAWNERKWRLQLENVNLQNRGVEK